MIQQDYFETSPNALTKMDLDLANYFALRKYLCSKRTFSYPETLPWKEMYIEEAGKQNPLSLQPHLFPVAKGNITFPISSMPKSIRKKMLSTKYKLSSMFMTKTPLRSQLTFNTSSSEESHMLSG